MDENDISSLRWMEKVSKNILKFFKISFSYKLLHYRCPFFHSNTQSKSHITPS